MPKEKSDDPAARGAGVLAPDNLPYQLFLLVQQMTKRFQEVLAPHELTQLHWGILCCLWRADGLATTQLAHQLEQLGGTITVGLDAMETRRLIRRRQDPSDRRVSRIYLTPRGRALESLLVPAAGGLIEEIFVGLTGSERAQFTEQVRSLRCHLATPATRATSSE